MVLKMVQGSYAILTSAGLGTRIWPTNWLGPGLPFPKGLMKVMGVRVSELQITDLRDNNGIKVFYFVTKHLSNKELLSQYFGDGERHGVKIDYSTTPEEMSDRGSGDALLRHITNRNLGGHSVVLANDILYQVDWQRAINFHLEHGSLITILSTYMKPRGTIGNYGLLDVNGNHRVRRIIEKPESVDDIVTALSLSGPERIDKLEVQVNTAGYIVDNHGLAGLVEEEWVKSGREEARVEEKGNFDMAGDLIKECVDRGMGIYAFPIDGWADLGTNPNYLQSVHRVIAGQFPSITNMFGDGKTFPCYQTGNRVFIHPRTYEAVNPQTGKTLEQMIRDGDVEIGPNVYIGARVVIEPGVRVGYSDIEKDVYLRRGATVSHSVIEPYCVIGENAHVERSVFGLAVAVANSGQGPTQIAQSFLGPEISVGAGSNIIGSTLYPRYRVEPGSTIKNEIINAPK